MKKGKIIEENDILKLRENGTYITAVGNIKDKKGYKCSNLNINILINSLNIIKDKFDIEAVDIWVSDDKPIQIGKDKVGLLIAPRIPMKSENRYKLESNEVVD